MAGKRHKARIAALKVLFEVDSASHQPDQIMDRWREEPPLPDGAPDSARHLVNGVLANRTHLDDIIRKNAPAWPLEQVAAVDRSILRLAIFEIVIDNMVPMRAAINEAVELAKEFGGEASPKFVNGVLGSVAATGTRR